MLIQDFRFARFVGLAVVTSVGWAACLPNKPKVPLDSVATTEVKPFDAVPTQEIFVLPQNYRGPFIAIYGQPDGKPPGWHGDTAIIVVPPSGVVRLPYPEPPTQTLTAHVFENARALHLRNYPTCADMRLVVTDSATAICWFDFHVDVGGTPEHVVAVVTNWNGIPKMFEATSQLYDSVLLGGKGIGRRHWEEPPDLKRKRAELRPAGRISAHL